MILTQKFWILALFFSYIPFILREGVSSYTIFEARDPAINCLLPSYKCRDINVKFVDMFDLFGPSHGHAQQLDLPSGSMNLILCWEVMEHFSFNPVKFCRELYRLLKPGGRVCVTVPNKASFQAIHALITGRN
jgi:SAM-dependent methyltransferase